MALIDRPSSPTAEVLQPRAFQYEMLEESLQSNIIIAAELEKAPSEKRIWFLAPHVELATQQARVIASQIPSVQTRLLLGADGVDHWSEQWIWDEILRGIKIVISTHQILLDALIHGFVRMAQLSLMIFDEAHHCIADHPASRILRDFYHPQRAMNEYEVPAILGLTASPVINSRIGGLQELEANLQSISRTTKLNREELLRYVHRPALLTLAYSTSGLEQRKSETVSGLKTLRMGLDIEEDPYVKALRSDPNSYNTPQLSKAVLSRKTYCQEQLKRLNTRAEVLEDELGPWAADWYIDACTRKLQNDIGSGSSSLVLLDDSEKLYLEQCLSKLLSSNTKEALLSLGDAQQSPKLLRLIDFLVSQRRPDFTGLLFVRTRAEVAVLSHILSMHPIVRKFYTVSTFVGASSSSRRTTNVSELVDVRAQISTLDDLRLGRKNLIVTTSALEEGIDVSACNTVICFDKPVNLKSLIQRRGRARKSESTFAMMLAENDDPSLIATWRQLEEKMQQQYMDDMRQLQQLEQLEAIDEGDREFVVKKTGAKLMLSDAVRHLYHFCATLLSRQAVSPAPTFTFKDCSTNENLKAISAKVLLPISVDVSVRETCSRSAWVTEKAAKRDAAFEAYVQLYHAGLVSDNLLPIRGYDEAAAELETKVETIASLVPVSGQLNPWNLVARQWQVVDDPSSLQYFELALHSGAEQVAAMRMLVPCPLPPIPPTILYWDANTTFTATVRSNPCETAQEAVPTDLAIQTTTLLLSSAFQSRMTTSSTDFLTLFVPSKGENPTKWVERCSGTFAGDRLQQTDTSDLSLSSFGVVRDMNHGGVRHILKGFQRVNSESSGVRPEPSNIESEEAELRLHVLRFPKRTDFLHSIQHDQSVHHEPLGMLLRPADCEIEKLPLPYAYFAATVPAILHHVSVRLVAAHLSNTLLAPVGFTDLELLVTAITVSAAQEATNYQRQEFLGDSVLKFLTSLMLKSKHLRWHEGVLSLAKDHIVSNASLAKAALAARLDSFILTVPFTGSKWKPLYVSDHLDNPTRKPRQISTKTLADVVEALIGAAFLEGGFDKATAMLNILLPQISWSPVLDSNSMLHSSHAASVTYPPHFSQLEQLVGYTFNLKSLPLEALTHPSYIGPNVSTSYDRLEFLGDVCLDIIVATASFKHEPPIPTHNLHLIRSAVVNAHFLAFLCLSLSLSVPRKNIITRGKDSDVSVSDTTFLIHIWQFMRHAHLPIRASQQDCISRYESLRDTVLENLHHGSYIPWALLARLDAPKFFSDIIESLIGAIYIDSHGSLTACEAFLEKLGVMGYLRRLLQGGMALYHPKEELGQLADTETVRYEIFREEGEEKKLSCVVLVGEREVARVGDGISVMEVETRGAEEAAQVLRKEGRRIGKKRRLDNDEALLNEGS
ncbi:MAG: hypothetical protein Q9219_005988 [cf. Caloplaca sp. 3 TL-2023]